MGLNRRKHKDFKSVLVLFLVSTLVCGAYSYDCFRSEKGKERTSVEKTEKQEEPQSVKVGMEMIFFNLK